MKHDDVAIQFENPVAAMIAPFRRRQGNPGAVLQLHVRLWRRQLDEVGFLAGLAGVVEGHCVGLPVLIDSGQFRLGYSQALHVFLYDTLDLPNLGRTVLSIELRPDRQRYDQRGGKRHQQQFGEPDEPSVMAS